MCIRDSRKGKSMITAFRRCREYNSAPSCLIVSGTQKQKIIPVSYTHLHPLDSMRGVIDAEKYTRIGLIDTLEPHELKQKTAYEIIAGDWSSDVCSSDL